MTPRAPLPIPAHPTSPRPRPRACDRPRTRRRRTIVAVVLLVLLAGCTGADPGGDPVADARTTPTPPSSDAGQGTASDDGADDDPDPDADEDADEGRDEDPDDEGGATGDRRAEAERLASLPYEDACAFAGEGFCDDENDNLLPDVLEVRAGRDPGVGDACLVSDCPEASFEALSLALRENTVFVLDASGSMAGAAGGGQTKMDAAKEALVAYAQGAPEFADLGLVVYGHRGDNTDAGRPESCAGVEVLAEAGDLTPETAGTRVAGFAATGWTPIATALQTAGPVLQRAVAADAAEGIEGAANRIILISDGLETCDGDPVAAAAALSAEGIAVVVDVIGFDLADSDRAALQEVAEVTGGRFIDAGSGQALRDVLSDYQRQIYDAAPILGCQRQALRQYLSCRTDLAGDVLDGFFDEGRAATAAGESDRIAFLNSWRQVVLDAFNAQTRDRQAAALAEIDLLEAQIREAVERRDATLGADRRKRVAFTCPFATAGSEPA